MVKVLNLFLVIEQMKMISIITIEVVMYIVDIVHMQQNMSFGEQELHKQLKLQQQEI